MTATGSGDVQKVKTLQVSIYKACHFSGFGTAAPVVASSQNGNTKKSAKFPCAQTDVFIMYKGQSVIPSK